MSCYVRITGRSSSSRPLLMLRMCMPISIHLYGIVADCWALVHQRGAAVLNGRFLSQKLCVARRGMTRRRGLSLLAGEGCHGGFRSRAPSSSGGAPHAQFVAVDRRIEVEEVRTVEMGRWNGKLWRQRKNLAQLGTRSVAQAAANSFGASRKLQPARNCSAAVQSFFGSSFASPGLGLEWEMSDGLHEGGMKRNSSDSSFTCPSLPYDAAVLGAGCLGSLTRDAEAALQLAVGDWPSGAATSG